MSLFDDASLVLTPNGVKSGKVYSIKPTDGVGDFDFTRASSATRVNSDGLIETVSTGVPRLDYPPLGGCPSLLLEPQRTNLVLRSEEFESNVYFTKTRSSVISNVIISPDGTQNADKLVEDTSVSTTHYLLSPINATVGTWTASIFVKKAERSSFAIYAFNEIQSVFGTTFFDLENGIVTSGNGKIENYGNEWYRCSLTLTLTITSRFDFLLANNGEIIYTGDGISGVYLWGAQLEAGSSPTSYIPTEGSTVTRVAEICSKTGISSLIGQTEGTLYAEVSFKGGLIAGENRHLFNVSDGTDANRVNIFIQSDTTEIRLFFNSPSGSSNIGTSFPNITTAKIALVYKSGESFLCVNGNLATTQSNTFSFNQNLSKINVGSRNNDTQQLNDHIKAASIFPTAITEAEAIVLTTL